LCAIFCATLRYNSSTNLSKKCSVSSGPGVASGWNWHEKYGRVLCAIPSFVSSLRFLSQVFQSFGRVESLIANPWFCDVT